MKILIILTLFSMVSCSSFINKIHRDLDRADGKANQNRRIRKGKRDTFARFRNPYYSNRKAPKLSNLPPKVRRNYKIANAARKRYTTDDLTDNQSDGSLWSGRGNNNYLFSLDQEKKNGDIIVINVFERLKKEITMELKRSVPVYKKPNSKKKADDKGDEKGKKKTASAPKPAKKEKSTTDAFDKISSVIIERINKDHFLLRGQKQILYKNKKRIIEILALIAKRDIEENDTIHSDKLLESNIYLVR